MARFKLTIPDGIAENLASLDTVPVKRAWVQGGQKLGYGRVVVDADGAWLETECELSIEVNVGPGEMVFMAVGFVLAPEAQRQEVARLEKQGQGFPGTIINSRGDIIDASHLTDPPNDEWR